MSKILLVDDDRDFLEAIKSILDEAGLGYIATASSDQVHQKARIYRPNLIILDIFLEHQNGLNLARELRRHHDTRFIPILLVSGSQDVEKLSQSINAQGFLQKPFTSQELVDSINRLIGKKSFSVPNTVAKAAY